MFARNSQSSQRQGSQPQSPQNSNLATAPDTNPATSMIGADVKIIGNDTTVVSKSQVQINGIVDGVINCKEVVVGDQGKITGQINAQAIDVRGAVEGSMHGNSVTLQNTARVNGDIHHDTIAIVEGARFEGRAHPSNT